MQINPPRCRPGQHSGAAGPNTMRPVKSNESQTRSEYSLNLGIFSVSVCVHLSTLCSLDPAKLNTDGQHDLPEVLSGFLVTSTAIWFLPPRIFRYGPHTQPGHPELTNPTSV
ncbi:hypothetical protein ATANTOWER_015837 [Ataeniobius toweri]|uniref:Uncharacterized protein n=1 Tax=Ataeniobius toweri TaxID=208326 RepID=A0ABU7BZE6_9TELE|nr:hypothetical protein [Ataeniobius toweri]